jgi:hypothetical protein
MSTGHLTSHGDGGISIGVSNYPAAKFLHNIIIPINGQLSPR